MKIHKVNFRDITSSMRFDSSYHLSEGTIYLKKLRAMPHDELDDITSSIFTAGRSKRVYTEKEFGYPYLSNTDVGKKSPMSSCKYNSRKFGYDESSFLREGMIVTGRVGAIGHTTYITSEFEEYEAMGSDNIIRIVPNDFSKSGYLYSFIASKYGNTLLWKLAAGGVQPYISEDMIKDMPIPKLSDAKQLQIHNLIAEASRLRVNANKALKLVHEIYLSTVEIRTIENKKQVKFNKIKSKGRLNANFFLSIGEHFEQQILNTDHYFIRDLTSEVFTSGREKRDYVKKLSDGKYFFSNTDLASINPYKSASVLRKSKAKKESVIRDNFLLTGRVGSVGEVTYPFNYLINHLASDNVIRMSFVDKDKMKLAYAFLSSSVGKHIIFKRKSGTNQPFITEDMLLDIPIPKLGDLKEKQVIEVISKYVFKIEQSFQKENQAIDLVEKEIESWQK